ncbi:MAG: hypothetical protein FWF43_00995 [Propionibacteriaceae bacterium]|nr:hypothetical protein [Propionibacteriaceae bacterium]
METLPATDADGLTPLPEYTDPWLLRDPVPARWPAGHRSTDIQSALTATVDPSHPHSVARDTSDR